MIVFSREGDLTVQRVAARLWGDWTLWPVIAADNRHHAESLGQGWEQSLPIGLPLLIRELPSAPSDHVVAAGDTWATVSLTYTGTELLSERIRLANGGGVLYGRAGSRITIPAFVDARLVAELRGL